MVSGRAIILNRLGLHARPAMTFVQTAMGFQASVGVQRTDSSETVDGKSIMQMLLVAGTSGTELVITCDGADEEAALAALLRLVARKFDEE